MKPNDAPLRWRTVVLCYLVVIAVPMLPLFGWLFSGATPFSLSLHAINPAPLDLPQPRVRTGLPAAAAFDCDVERRGPSPFSWRAIRERAGKWTLKTLESPKWRLLMTEHFVLRSDALLDDLRFAGVYLEEAHAAQRRDEDLDVAWPRRRRRCVR